MPQTIWKYELEITDEQTINIPEGSVILDVLDQNGTLVLYAMVNPQHPHAEHTVRIVGTGHPLPEEPGDFINSVMMDQYVWHVFA